jgi:geranylgeranyl diphosphate synthase, type I
VTLPAVLEGSASVVAPELRAAADELSPGMRAILGYHLGWLDADGNPVAAGGGKAVRATLALLSARAAGGTDADGIPGAVAVELVHTFSLLHDDIMDGDEERHHRPAAWAVFGRARAILAGDAVLALAYRRLLAARSPHRLAAVEALADATARLIDGQAADLDLEGRVDATPEECTRMYAGKTGALLECAASIGAVLVGADERTVRGLRAFGAHLGLAFQAVDDLLGIWGDPEVTGKPVHGDLVQRKSSLPVSIALAAGGDGSSRLRALLARPVLSADDLAAAAELVERCGGRSAASAQAETQLQLALDALDAVDIDAEAEAAMAAVARFVAAREY